MSAQSTINAMQRAMQIEAHDMPDEDRAGYGEPFYARLAKQFLCA